MRIFLVRHGQSQSNADWDVNRHTADHAIELTEDGKRQASECGKFLAEHFYELDIADERVTLWQSPYMRTRRTATEILAQFDRRRIRVNRREHLLLAEQQFGIFDGLSDAEREERYPAEQAYYEKCKRFEGKLWPKMPLGESRFDVCQRVHQAFGTFKRDEEKHGIENIIVVAHGTVNRAFVMMWLHLPCEWMHEEPNPKNCSVRLLDDGIDKGYIFPGFDDHENYKHVVTKETEE